MAEKKDPGHNGQEGDPGQGWRRIFQPLRWLAGVFRIENVKPAQLGWATILLFVGFSVLAYRQFRQPYRWHEPYPRFSSSWWLHPAEWNLDAGLPRITGNINTVLPASDGKLWIAGEDGLLAFSKDQGDSWTLLEFDTSGREFRVPQAKPAKAALARPARSGSWRWPNVVSIVYAASKQKSQPQSQTTAPSPETQQNNTLNQADVTQQTASTALIVASPSRVSFGPVQVGSAGSYKFQFRNVSKQQAMVTLDSLTSKDFRVEKDGCVKRLLQPGEACTVFIAFSPHATGRTAAVLRARMQNGLYVDVPLSGIGLQKPAGVGKVQPPGNVGTIGVWHPPTQAPDLLELETSGNELKAVADSVLYISKDAGAHWLAHEAPPPSPKDTSLIATITQQGIRVRMTSNEKRPLAPQIVDGIKSVDHSRYTLKEVALAPDQREGWLVGRNGVILRTNDGGAHWYPATQSARLDEDTDDLYVRFLPPWYWLALLLCGVLASPLLAPPGKRAQESEADAEWRRQLAGINAFTGFAPVGRDKEHLPNLPSQPVPSSIARQAVADKPLDPPSRPQDGIGNKAISDKPLEPGEPDALGLGTIAAGLAFFLRNDKTRPPLAIGINGRWGSGKSSLMNLLKKSLEDSGSRPVWFNAWHHQKEEQLLAALLQAVKAQAVPLWSSWNGWIFRARLAAIRVQRSWLRLTMLAALLFLMYRAEVFLRDSGVTFGTLLHFLFAGPSENKLKSLLGFMKDNSVVTLVTGILAALKALSNGLTAFGTNPASLLTAMSGGTKVKDLDAQTSFRQRFAAEFADVTKALGDRRRMLILIDDLDRCRPEKVREVLEAVNFLVSSGDCFIVLGMARDIVEHCVGLSFRRTVDTLSWDAMGLSQEEIERFIRDAQVAAAEGGGNGNGAGQEFAAVEVAAKRRAFARLYLDKLIQIEVAVPEPTRLQKRLLFQTDEEQSEKPKNELRAEKVLRVADAGSRWLAPWIRAALVASVVIGAGLLAGHSIKPMARQFFVLPSDASQPPSTDASIASRAGRSLDANRSPSLPAAPEPTPSPVPREQPQIQPGSAGAHLGWLAFWPFYLMGLVALGLVSTALRRVPERTITDTKPFVNALNIWHPLVMTSGAKNTPRTARRFQNRVRYLAMRQRALSQGPPQSRFERWVRRSFKAEVPKPYPLMVLPDSGPLPRAIDEESRQLRELLDSGRSGDTPGYIVREGASGMEVTSKNGSQQGADFLLSLVRGWVYIPEPLLVALAAIEEYEPQWISDQTSFRQFVDFDPSGLYTLEVSPDSKPYGLFFAAAFAHIKNWPGWYNMVYYRRAYMELSNGSGSSAETPPRKRVAASH